MADHPLRSQGSHGNLDASGPRQRVYCHQCENDWYQDEHGLTCPRCAGEITEIITADSDPRPGREAPNPPPGLHDLHNHNPSQDSDVSDPEEADIEEHITHGPGGSVFFSQTLRTSTPHGRLGGQRRRGPLPQNDPANIIQDFQNIIGTLIDPNLRMGQPGRSGPDAHFSPLGGENPDFAHRRSPFAGGFFGGLGDNGVDAGPGPAVIGGRFTYTTGHLRPRDADGPQPGGLPGNNVATYASPLNPRSPNGSPLYVISITARPDQLASIIGNIFGPMGQVGPPGHLGDDQQENHRGPPALQGLLASILNPANAVHGDSVFTQEALDRIISNLMEQHPTSNAPGPASPAAIAALPKKKLAEEELGPELKGECSVCMDDVHVGDEVTVLPCGHWFHEACAGAWLSEHNTCPICRKGIEGDTPPPNSRRPSQSSSPVLGDNPRTQRIRLPRRSSRSEARSESIRDRRRLSPTQEAPPIRWQVAGDGGSRTSGHDGSVSPPLMPSSFRRRDSEFDDNQRDTRRGGTGSSNRSLRRSSQASSGGNGGGPMAWLRDRFSSGGNSRRHD